jgi:2',3'-cyclic-nucleotide 2'-phosphodiesterase (5'-nucleotidase family)
MNKILTFSVLLFLISCSGIHYSITGMKGIRIPVDNSVSVQQDNPVVNMIQPYKSALDVTMNEVIGYAPATMRGHAPESLLSNYCADIYRETATDFLKKPVDIAIVNLGGLRTTIPAGNVTIRKMYELMPFENELVIIGVKGSNLIPLFHRMALAGGEGISGMNFIIYNGKAVDINIGGEKLNPEKVYFIATNNYLSEGNDNMPELRLQESAVQTGIKVRDMLTFYIKKATSEGKKVESKIDGRITQK